MPKVKVALIWAKLSWSVAEMKKGADESLVPSCPTVLLPIPEEDSLATFLWLSH